MLLSLPTADDDDDNGDDSNIGHALNTINTLSFIFSFAFIAFSMNTLDYFCLFRCRHKSQSWLLILQDNSKFAIIRFVCFVKSNELLCILGRLQNYMTYGRRDKSRKRDKKSGKMNEMIVKVWWEYECNA